MARTPVSSPNPYTFTLTAGHLSVQDGTNWEEQDAFTGYVEALGTKFGTNYDAQSECYWKGTFSENQYAQITLTVGAGGADDAAGVCLRSSGSKSGSNLQCYRVIARPYGSGVIRVVKVSGGGTEGTPTDIAQATTTGDVLAAECVTNGGNAVITVYLNGSPLGTTFTDSSSPYTTGNPGVSARGAIQLVLGDDFVAGDVTAGGGGIPKSTKFLMTGIG